MAALNLTLAILLQAVIGGAAPAHPDAPTQADTEIDQLPGAQPLKPDLSPHNVAPPAKGHNPALVQQLPQTLEAPRERDKGEGALIHEEKDKGLAGEVARTAELLRQRGQQPTPEALAREIGPDALASFLNQDPSSLDAYSTPKDDGKAAPTLPQGAEGTVIILPSPSGS